MEISRQELLLNSELSPAEVREVQRLVVAGDLKRIARGMATHLPEEQWPALLRRHKLRVAAANFPGGVVTHRSAFTGAVENDLTLAYSYSRRLDLLGLSIFAFAGAGPTQGDTPIGKTALYWASQERMLLDNLSRNISNRNVDVEQVEERLALICDTIGEEHLNQVRQKAEFLAPGLQRQSECKSLSAKIGAILGTRESKNLTSKPIAAAVDHQRLERFDELIRALKSAVLPALPDPASAGESLTNFAFLESYFSNFIEGTEFDIYEAADIALNGKLASLRPKDSHDILGVFRQIVTPSWRLQSLLATPACIDQLIERHKDMMGARPEVEPGQIKTTLNRAGSTVFVAPRQVRATLTEAAARIDELEPGLARALYAMFVVSEVHPFNDGNGRLARLIMNAELSSAQQCRIIIPTLYRETYLDNLKVLTNSGDAAGFIKSMCHAQQWTSRFDYSDFNVLISAVRRTNALERSMNQFKLLDPWESNTDTDQAQSRPAP